MADNANNVSGRSSTATATATQSQTAAAPTFDLTNAGLKEFVTNLVNAQNTLKSKVRALNDAFGPAILSQNGSKEGILAAYTALGEAVQSFVAAGGVVDTGHQFVVGKMANGEPASGINLTFTLSDKNGLPVQVKSGNIVRVVDCLTGNQDSRDLRKAIKQDLSPKNR